LITCTPALPCTREVSKMRVKHKQLRVNLDSACCRGVDLTRSIQAFNYFAPLQQHRLTATNTARPSNGVGRLTTRSPSLKAAGTISTTCSPCNGRTIATKVTNSPTGHARSGLNGGGVTLY